MTDAALLKLINERLHYDPDTGVFTWKLSTGRSAAGSVAGTVADKYAGSPRLLIRIGGRLHHASRLAVAITTGVFPKGDVDHVNHDTLDNRINNLRIVDRLSNNKNVKRKKNNTSGAAGVHFQKSAGKWSAQIGVNYKTVHLGLFAKFDDAVEARRKAEAQYDFHPNHGK
jgi:hypothetical protein